MREKVKEYFHEAIRLKKDIPDDLRESLLNHERVNLFIDNLSGQLMKCQELRSKKGKPHYKLKTIKETVYDFADVFIHTVVVEADRRVESTIAEMSRQDVIQKQKDLESTANGKPAGEYEELFDQGVEYAPPREEANQETKA